MAFVFFLYQHASKVFDMWKDARVGGIVNFRYVFCILVAGLLYINPFVTSRLPLTFALIIYLSG